MGAVNEFFMQQGIAAPAEAPKREKLTLGWRGKSAPVPDVIFDDYVDPAKVVAALEVALAPKAERAPLQVAPWIEPSPLDICLGHWVSWMQQDDRDLGAKVQAVICGGTDDGEEHEGFDATSAAADAAAARISRDVAMATDAMINSLPRDYKAAIWRRCNITSVWKFPNMDFTAILPDAERALAEKLSKNVATRAFW